MLRTVRSRIFFFSTLSVSALAVLAFISWAIMSRAERATHHLLSDNLGESWVLNDLESDHRRLQDLAFKIKAQLMLWDEIHAEFGEVAQNLELHWKVANESAPLTAWVRENELTFALIQELVASMGEGIEQESYYRVGQVVDFRLFPAVDPMLDAISRRKAASREQLEVESTRLLVFLERQKFNLLLASAAFLVAIVVITAWLRRTVIVRLQKIERDLRAMDSTSDLTRLPRVSGTDEVAGLGAALTGLVDRFEHFIVDIRGAAASLVLRSEVLEAQAHDVQASSTLTRQQIIDVNQSATVIADQASAIEQATTASDLTVTAAVRRNLEVQQGLRNSEQAAEHAVTVIDRVSDSIQVLNESSSKIEQVIGVIADIAEQTNLLALNAAIEAARAGDQGRGFAVVAEEVRNLSRRTSESTGEIRQWVHDLLDGVGDVGGLLSEMREAGGQNRSYLDALKRHLEGMKSQFEDLEAHSLEISRAVLLQRDEIGRVGRRAQALDASAETLSCNVEQTLDVSEALRDESRIMTELASRFTTSG
ncbi:methyl-accepting chemotaxis protein [Marinobacter mobilis]|uniref:methyl-accepting chemotaxis protein n=1 Tax=Marinobacter mobilis TaxID=488533 RepID=UPI0035C66D5B